MKAQQIFTKAEVEAYHLLHEKHGSYDTSKGGLSFNEAGNKIIELAEKIKAERAIVSMYNQ